jgi:hypothetical protein
VGDPDSVAVKAKLDPSVNQRLWRSVEAGFVFEVAVKRHPRRSASGEVEVDRRQRPGHLALYLKAIGDDEVAACVAPWQGVAVLPVGVLPIDVVQVRKASGRPEALFGVANGAFG